jgi:hypothetical protein
MKAPLSWAQLVVGHLPSGGEGCFGLPSLRRRDTGASLATATTTSWIENASAMIVG